MDYPAIRVGDILGRAFGLYRRHLGLLILVGLPIFVVVAVLGEVLGRDEPGPLVIAQAVSFAATVVYQGIVVGLVVAVREERPEPSVGEMFRAVGPVLGPLVGGGILFGIGVGIGLFLLLVPGLILLTLWAVIAPVIVVERKEMFPAFGRSRELVRGYGWPVFGTILVANLIVGVAAVVFLLIATAIVDSSVLRVIFSILAGVFTAPIDALVTAILYFQLLELKGQSRR